MLSTDKVVDAERYLLLQGLYVYQMSKLKYMYVTGLILLLVVNTRNHTKLYPATH